MQHVQKQFVQCISCNKAISKVLYGVESHKSAYKKHYVKLIKIDLRFVWWQVKSHIWIFVNALIENPTFDSQAKENMTLQHKSFGSKCSLSEKFMNSVITSDGLVK